MPVKRDLCLQDCGVSKYAYKELYYFCLQYDEKKEMLKQIYGVRAAVPSFAPKAVQKSDTTWSQAEKALRLRRDIELIEQSALEADGNIYKYILENVTHGTPYEFMGIPCGRRQFYEKRRKFFHILYEKKG